MNASILLNVSCVVKIHTGAGILLFTHLWSYLQVLVKYVLYWFSPVNICYLLIINRIQYFSLPQYWLKGYLARWKKTSTKLLDPNNGGPGSQILFFSYSKELNFRRHIKELKEALSLWFYSGVTIEAPSFTNHLWWRQTPACRRHTNLSTAKFNFGHQVTRGIHIN